RKGTSWTMTGLFDYRETYADFDQTWGGVPIYFHDYFGPGKTAKVLSVGARDVLESPERYRDESRLTGKSTRVAQLRGVAVANLLEPIGDLPPTTVVTHVRKAGDRLVVHGTTADNGTVTNVLVNGESARALSQNFGEWEAVLAPAAAGNKLEIRAHAS